MTTPHQLETKNICDLEKWENENIPHLASNEQMWERVVRAGAGVSSVPAPAAVSERRQRLVIIQTLPASSLEWALNLLSENYSFETKLSGTEQQQLMFVYKLRLVTDMSEWWQNDKDETITNLRIRRLLRCPLIESSNTQYAPIVLELWKEENCLLGLFWVRWRSISYYIQYYMIVEVAVSMYVHVCW